MLSLTGRYCILQILPRNKPTVLRHCTAFLGTSWSNHETPINQITASWPLYMFTYFFLFYFLDAKGKYFYFRCCWTESVYKLSLTIHLPQRKIWSLLSIVIRLMNFTHFFDFTFFIFFPDFMLLHFPLTSNIYIYNYFPEFTDHAILPEGGLALMAFKRQ